MSLYDLPEIKIKKLPTKLSSLELPKPKALKSRIFWSIILTILISSFFGFLAGSISGSYFYLEAKDYLNKLNTNTKLLEPQIIEKEKIIEKIIEYKPYTSQEQAIVNAVKNISPAVVSIVITKDVINEKKEMGGGTGFIVSENGMILTNKHVVLDEEANYTIFLNDGKKFPAKVLARDEMQDLAIMEIEQETKINDFGEIILETFPYVNLGNSLELQIGQTVIAIGNALGEFRNTVSVGVISGLGRTVTASGNGLVLTIENLIQTDAAINKGNSGGPLMNLKGEVIGINTAMVEGAQSIGFAIVINRAKRDIEQIKKLGKIVYPFLGVYYTLITDNLKDDHNLPVDYGAWVGRNGKGENVDNPIFSDSTAEKAGIKTNDIILEFNNEKITLENSLAKIIQKYEPGDKITLMILRQKENENYQEKIINLILGEKTE